MASSVIKKTIASGDIVNDLNSTATDKPLSAYMGMKLNNKTALTYGDIDEIITNITYQKFGNVITLFINGVSVNANPSWTDLVTLPDGFAVRYNAHFKSIDGTDIQITSNKLRYRNVSNSTIFAAFTYISSGV